MSGPEIKGRLIYHENPVFPDVLREYVPGTYGEAVMQGWIEDGDCEPHEWDNRTSAGNARWMLERLLAERKERRNQKREKGTEVRQREAEAGPQGGDAGLP